jgi:hypothetical protein
MWSPAVVEVQILADGSAGFRHVGVGLQVYLLVFDALPDTFDEDVVAPDAACELRPKPVDPEPHRFAADCNAALGQKVLDIRCAQREPMISPDRIGNDLMRIAKALQAQK